MESDWFTFVWNVLLPLFSFLFAVFTVCGFVNFLQASAVSKRISGVFSGLAVMIPALGAFVHMFLLLVVPRT